MRDNRSSSPARALNPETEIPRNRIVFFGGVRCFGRSRARLERSLAVAMTAPDLLRVINSKSENLTLSVGLARPWPRSGAKLYG
jgi:hypothetical protein